MTSESECGLNDLRWQQCCCNCRWHIEDRGYPPLFRESKGWICANVEFLAEGLASSDWPEHSIGCELYEDKTRTDCGESLRERVYDICKRIAAHNTNLRERGALPPLDQ